MLRVRSIRMVTAPARASGPARTRKQASPLGGLYTTSRVGVPTRTTSVVFSYRCPRYRTVDWSLPTVAAPSVESAGSVNRTRRVTGGRPPGEAAPPPRGLEGAAGRGGGARGGGADPRTREP